MRRRVSIVTAAICWLSISAMAVAWGAPRGGRVVIEVYPGPNAINDALDVANPGDVLNIHSGSYPEHVTVRVPRVTLQAAGDGLVTVDGTCTRGTPWRSGPTA